jgi:membrane-associated phospholipid phosphatase
MRHRVQLHCRYLLLLLLSVLPIISRAQDTAASSTDSRLRFSADQIAAPVLLSVAGIASMPHFRFEVRDWRNEHLPGFHTKLDNVLAVSPIFAVYLLDWAGLPAQTDIRNRTAMLAKAEMLCVGTVYGLKYISSEERPDRSDTHSFPSNHTAQAFMAATFLSQEYKSRYPWMPYAAYTLATGVGCLRIANNRHYISDVLVGAGIGILSQKIAYWTHQYRWHKKARKLQRAEF